MRKSFCKIVLFVAIFSGLVFLSGEAAETEGTRLFYRMLGSETNAPLLPKTRTVCLNHGAERTGTTGMADSGFTEYPFCSGTVSYTFAETYAYFPRIASGLNIDPDHVNTGDILIDHVYEPDGCVWGPSGREFTQTFVATGRELVSVTLLVATEPGLFRAALLKGGPHGPQVGPARTFHSGHSMETGNARWKAGEAPLEPGSTYAIRLWRDDGSPWKPYLHSTGNAYDDGLLYVDGVARPESDLAAWIIEEPPDLSRAIIEDSDAGGWVFNAAGVVFIPRTPNVRLISVAVSPVETRICDVILRVWSTGEESRLLAGPKRCLSGAPENQPHSAHFLFAQDELQVTPGERYRIDLFTIPYKADLPATIQLLPKDIQARVYGEPEPGSLSAIGNLSATFDAENSLRLSWITSSACPVALDISRGGSSDRQFLEFEPGTREASIPKLWPGHDYDFKLQAIGPTGLRWNTPVYRIRVPRGPHPSPPPYIYPEHPEELLQIAPPPLPKPPSYGALRFTKEVKVANPDFEEGLAAWETDPEGGVQASREQHGISPPAGRTMAGWSHAAGEDRKQVFQEGALYQTVPTTSGHHYILSARAHTSVCEGGPRGDTRVRLFADPDGGTDFSDRNSSQWYWTDGRWLWFQHRWLAGSDRSTVGFGFFRWRDLDLASAYVDHVRVFDLGPAPQTASDPAARHEVVPRVTLSDARVEAGERVEAELLAPPGYVVTGIGARAAGDNVTTLRIRIQPLLPDGTLGDAEEMAGGWEPDAGLEANIDLPAGYVATGFGARIAPEWDVKTLAVWGRPLLPGGPLGEEEEFRAGVEPKGGLEKKVQLEVGRVLISAGLRCSFNDVGGISAQSAAILPTATGRVAGIATMDASADRTEPSVVADQNGGFVRLSQDGQGFTVDGTPWHPFGCNYFDPHVGWAPKLWQRFDEEKVEEHFRVMRDLGVNVVRVFLTAQSFFPEPPNLEAEALRKFDAMLAIGRKYGIRIHPTGPDHWEGTPAWRRTDFIADPQALEAQAAFWNAFAARYRDEPFLFAYDLLNEPHVRWDTPAMRAKWPRWLRDKYGSLESLRQAWGDEEKDVQSFEEIAIPPDAAAPESPALLDFQHFRESLGDDWVRAQVNAIRAADPNHLVTVGLIQWTVPVNYGRPSRYAAFRPSRIAPILDFLSIHFYPLYSGDPLASEENFDRNLAYLEFVLRYVKAGSPQKPLFVGEFGWHGGGRPDGLQEWSADDQSRWCRAAVLQGRGIAAGWLNWAYADTPSSRDTTKFSGLVTDQGKPKPWGLAFRELAANPLLWTQGSPLPKGEIAFDADKAIVDPQAADGFLRGYHEIWTREKGCRLTVR